MALIMWMGLGQQVAVASGTYTLEQKVVSIENCPCLNSTILPIMEPMTDSHNSHLFFLYRISYLWYSAIGFIVTIIVGMSVSAITGFQDPKEVDSDLLSPPMKSLYDSFPNNWKEFLNIPLKRDGCFKDSTFKGVVNLGMDLEEKLEKCEKTDEKNRKISVISNHMTKF